MTQGLGCRVQGLHLAMSASMFVQGLMMLNV